MFTVDTGSVELVSDCTGEGIQILQFWQASFTPKPVALLLYSVNETLAQHSIWDLHLLGGVFF